MIVKSTPSSSVPSMASTITVRRWATEYGASARTCCMPSLLSLAAW